MEDFQDQHHSSENLEARIARIEQELDTLRTTPALQVEKRHVEPEKPRDGMIVLADGTDWNPGGGEGFYVYYNAQWTQLLDSLGAGILALDNTFTGENTFEGITNFDDPVECSDAINMTGAAVNYATTNIAAHATTMDIWSGANHKTMTGGALTVTDVADAPQAGALRWLRANAAHTITNGGAIAVQGGENYVCEDGDWMLWFAKTISTFNVLIFPVDGNPITAPAAPTGVPIGTIIAFGDATPPTDYVDCSGAAVSRTVTYDALYAVIGTTWGVGDGSTTFNLPNLDRHTLIGSGGSGTGTVGNAVGNKGGAETHTLSIAEMPAHTHSEEGTQSASTKGGLSSGISAQAGNTGSAGGGGAHNIMQKSAVVMYCIKYQ